MFAVTNCQVEYTTNPLGIDEPCPRFSWMLQSTARSTLQTAYRIQVASSIEELSAGRADVWDSGRVESAESAQIVYAGSTLKSCHRYYWRITAWDNHGQCAQPAENNFFEMGLMHPSDWRAKWIGYTPAWAGRSLRMRNAFEVSKPVERARLYATGVGYYEPRLNGAKIGDQVLEPAWTAYSTRICYRTYDVTGHIVQGRNVIAAILGHGWYGSPRLLMQLHVDYVDGSSDCIATGWGWKVACGPILQDSIYEGESYDARLESPGWDTAADRSIDSANTAIGWYLAMLSESPGGKLVASGIEPIRVVETLRPVAIHSRGAGIHVVDFGQNFAGWARIRVCGASGTTIKLKFAEALYDDGHVNQENLRFAYATDTYIMRGNGPEEWEPRFTYHGFRYVQVEGWPGELCADDIAGRVVRSSVARRGHFECDHPLVNRIQRAVEWTEGSNLHSVPTDCPQRDERLGWLNDMTARAEEAVYNYDMVKFLSKWLDDIADAQDESGAIPDTVPHRFCHQPADPVCICYVLLPWLIYQHYGDQRLLSRHYRGMKGWVDALGARAKDHILSYSYWGDWAAPVYRKGLPGPAVDTPVNLNTPGELVSTAFLAYASRLLAQCAAVLGHQADKTHYDAQADQIAQAFNRAFWNAQTRCYSTGSQSCQILPLHFGIASADQAALAMKSLLHDIAVVQDGHLATGNICTKYLPEVLTDAGHAEVAFQLATRETYPSWGYMMANGATTIWERWEKANGSGMNSHNHPMLGSISAWFYRALAGLRMHPSCVGASHLLIRPSLVSGINSVSASLTTLRGEATVKLKREGTSLSMQVTIPAGSVATLCVPRIQGAKNEVLRLDDRVIWPSAQGSAPIADATLEQVDSQYVTLKTGSGHYTLAYQG